MSSSSKISFRLDNKKKEAIEKIAKLMDTTSSDLIRSLINNFLEITQMYESLSSDKIFSSNPLLTVNDFLNLKDEGESVWNQWYKEETDKLLKHRSERNIIINDQNSTR